MRRLFLISILILGAIITACSSASPVVSVPASTSQAASASSVSASSSATVSSPPKIKVEADDDFFRPEKITITAGTQVTWTNVGKKTHTVTYKDMFDVDIHPGETFSYTFDKAGVYQYYCVTHSESETEGMVGTITVTEKK